MLSLWGLAASNQDQPHPSPPQPVAPDDGPLLSLAMTKPALLAYRQRLTAARSSSARLRPDRLLSRAPCCQEKWPILAIGVDRTRRTHRQHVVPSNPWPWSAAIAPASQQLIGSCDTHQAHAGFPCASSTASTFRPAASAATVFIWPCAAMCDHWPDISGDTDRYRVARSHDPIFPQPGDNI